MKYIPQKIIIDNDLNQNQVVRQVVNKCSRAEIKYARHPLPRPSDNEKTLYLINNPSRFFKPCPATPEYVCCNYQILNFSTGCPVHCTYCILNGYFSSRALSFYCNLDRMFKEVGTVLGNQKGFMRMGSGEFTDSLVLDHLTGFSKQVIPFFLKKKNVLFEIKTKTDNIGNLLCFKPERRIMVSWSVNPETIVKKEEKLSAPLLDRIKAAQACMKQGYLIGFHFDPIIKHEGWENHYRDLVDLIYDHIDPEWIAWISLGCFRFSPELKPVIQKRFPKTKVIYEEFVQGKDGKMRYFRPIREHIYSTIIDRIRKYHKIPPVYFCMETPSVWERVLGRNNFKSNGLSGLLDQVKKKFNL